MSEMPDLLLAMIDYGAKAIGFDARLVHGTTKAVRSITIRTLIIPPETTMSEPRWAWWIVRDDGDRVSGPFDTKAEAERTWRGIYDTNEYRVDHQYATHRYRPIGAVGSATSGGNNE